MNFTIWEMLLIGFYLGIAVGCWLHRKPPQDKPPLHKTARNKTTQAESTIDHRPAKDAKHTINRQTVFDWLEAHGLTWMPKGVTFDPHKEIRK